MLQYYLLFIQTLSTLMRMTTKKIHGQDRCRDKPHLLTVRKEVYVIHYKLQTVPVMLTRNIDVEDGLVNGSFGRIAQIVTQTQNGENRVHMLGLELDSPHAGQRHRNKVPGRTDNLVYIERTEENLSKKGAVRKQLPLKLAFA